MKLRTAVASTCVAAYFADLMLSLRTAVAAILVLDTSHASVTQTVAAYFAFLMLSMRTAVACT